MDDETKIENNSPEQISSTVSPEALASSAFAKDTKQEGTESMTASTTGNRKKLSGRFSLSNLSKKQKILLGIVMIIVLLLTSFLSWWFFFKPKQVTQPASTAEVEEAPAPTTEASRLTGVQVDPEINKRHVTGIMIENSMDSRPQSGLIDADIVYEAVAEGGITRFLALFQDKKPKYIGPVRSARPYYIDWLLPFDAGYAHVGGSPDALKQIKQLKIKDLDQFANSGAYERVSSRYAPHNVYTSIAKLDALEKQKGYTTSNVLGFTRKVTETPKEKATAKTINFGISSVLYNVKYSYNKKTNSYLRNMGGTAHKDEKSGKQISPKVVIGLVMTKGLMSDGKHTKYGTTGSGKMFVFQDGLAIKGTWKKTARDKQFTFKKADGSEIQLNPGNTWITILSDASSVSYKP